MYIPGEPHKTERTAEGLPETSTHPQSTRFSESFLANQDDKSYLMRSDEME